jgi:hypothetical protein
VVVVLILLKLLSWVTFFIPDWLMITLVAEIIAVKPFFAPFEGKLAAELRRIRENLESVVMKVYRMVPRYIKPVVP